MGHPAFDKAAATIAAIGSELQAELDKHSNVRRLFQTDEKNYADLKHQIATVLTELKDRRREVADAEAAAKRTLADAQTEANRILGAARTEADRLIADARRRVTLAQSQLEIAR
jgi:cell division septum initiation protein DivIVA